MKNEEMHPQIRLMKQSELEKLRNERTAIDSQIAALENELNLKKADDKQPTPAQQFQQQRDSMPNPFGQK